MSAASPSTDVPTRRDVWVRMLIYPRHTLPTALAPVLVAAGLALHDGVFAPGAAAAALAAGWLIQLGGVVADNYHNLRRHPDDREHPLLVRALEAGVVDLRLLARATAGCYLLAALPGAYLVRVGGVPALGIGIVSAGASLAYSSDPLRLGDRGLGDPLFFLFFGIVSVWGAYYVQAASTLAAGFPTSLPGGSVTPESLAAGLPMAALITNILLIDNIRDLRFDREKGERTLAVIVGRGWTEVEMGALTALAYAVPVWFLQRPGHGVAVLLPLITLPYAVVIFRRVRESDHWEELLPLTPQAGQLAVAYALLFAGGLAL